MRNGVVVSSYDALKPLADEQRRAADPEELVWLSASAGTGKTQVLSARVLRLLLRSDDFKPETILCLTFTKAGATEMADRINSRLARWVMASDTDIAIDLKSLGERFDPEMVKRARTLFARVLDARGGGLRIQTIHSFCQSLLGSFPAEIGLPPGFTLIEPREEAALPMRLLAEMAVAAEREGRLGFGEKLRALGHRLDEDRIQKLLIRCAKVPDVMAALPGGDGLLPYIRRMLCGGIDDVAGWLAARVETLGFVSDELDQLIAYNASWGTKTGLDRNAVIANWREKSGEGRVAGLKTLQDAWITKSGTLHKVVPKPVADHYTALCETLHRWCAPLVEMQLRAQQAEEFALMLSVGREFADHYVQAKRMRGLVDYDDLIRKTVELLEMPGMGDWIRYKLDQATDHILIDEAQDTNDRQWAIIKAIAGEFFVGSGARGTVHRTLFTVGDYKQAIFGFQGTDPRHFSAAQGYFGEAAEAVERDLLDLSLSRSFRSSPPILDLVDAVISGIGGDALGLSALPPRHVSARGGGGAITLMPPVVDLGSDEGDEDEESWVPQSARKLASDIAEQVKGWLDGGLWLEKEGRAIEPQDVLVLVRSRGELAALIVAQLHKVRVPVAGVDRLQLGLPLAVKDLLACVRFALQPLDDLNLAALLVSPLFGWSQEQLFETAHARGDRHLWPHLRQTLPEERLHSLYLLLNNADFSTPYAFLEMILSGEMDGRRKLIARLGDEARDPIDELLNAALDYARNHPPSLQLFLDWFDRGDVEIKRDASAASNAVRVMTVHGAKGLQAPVVILADATAKPKKAKGGDLFDWVSEDGLKLPLLRPSVAELTGSLRTSAEESDAAEAREHWRLLYVALTRAEERLVITGALGPQAQGVVPEGSWYQAIDTALMTMGVEGVDGRKDYVVTGTSAAKAIAKSVKPAPPERPAWLAQAKPIEARPPRPLAPSSLGKDDVADPPPTEVMKAAADRGRWLHALFERLPGAAGDRAAVADRWLAQSAGVDDSAMRAELIKSALTVIDDPAYAALFGADALAEAPIAGVVGGDVIAGTVDRLIVTEDSVMVVDFKTGRRVPPAPAACPVPHLRQMAAYHALLATIFPDKLVSAALLYTAGPMMHILPETLLAAHKPGLSVR
jgi:ATP-dependent helicase/nuclease subunit A